MKSVMCKRCPVPADGARRSDLSLSAVIMVRSYATDRRSPLSEIQLSETVTIAVHRKILRYRDFNPALRAVLFVKRLGL
jgi:hypothetical protein